MTWQRFRWQIRWVVCGRAVTRFEAMTLLLALVAVLLYLVVRVVVTP